VGEWEHGSGGGGGGEGRGGERGEKWVGGERRGMRGGGKAAGGERVWNGEGDRDVESDGSGRGGRVIENNLGSWFL